MVLGQILFLLSGLHSVCWPVSAAEQMGWGSSLSLQRFVWREKGNIHSWLHEHVWCRVLLSLGFQEGTFTGTKPCGTNWCV